MNMPPRSPSSSDRLVSRFLTLALAQEDALLLFDTKLYNRLYWQLRDSVADIVARDGDGRALFALLDHASAHVRYVAATTTYDLDRNRARQVLQAICDEKVSPYMLYAGSALALMDERIGRK